MNEFIKTLPEFLSALGAMSTLNLLVIVLGLLVWRLPEVIKALKTPSQIDNKDGDS